ncbi:unnamed protein product, partial [Didymodactylos carnosus]
YVANESLKAGKSQQVFTAQVIGALELMKETYSDDELIKSMSTGQQVIEELITVLTGETNDIENDSEKSTDQLRVLMRKYYTIGGLSDVLSVFGTVKDDFIGLGKMSKSRAVTIFRELKSGAGLGGEAASKPSFGSGASSNAAYRPPSPVRPNIPPQQPPSSVTYDTPYSGYDQQSNAPPEIIMQAQKLCRYANSALEHEDISTAIKNCEQVLQLLRQYNH